jgi:hypothetical protein
MQPACASFPQRISLRDAEIHYQGDATRCPSAMELGQHWNIENEHNQVCNMYWQRKLFLPVMYNSSHLTTHDNVFWIASFH